MTQYKEFQAKNLDDAIKEACGYFGVEREKLEIDIVSDAKSGIFGLVGAKKATIRAARRYTSDEASSLFNSDVGEDASRSDKKADVAEQTGAAPVPAGGKGGRSARSGKNDRNENSPQPDSRISSRPGGRSADKEEGGKSPAGTRSGRQAKDRKDSEAGGASRRSSNVGPAAQATSAEKRSTSGKTSSRSGKQASTRGAVTDQRDSGKEENRSKGRKATPGTVARHGAKQAVQGASQPCDSAFGQSDDLPDFDLKSCDPAELSELVCLVVLRLVTPIVGEVPCSVEINKDSVRASLDCGDASGLLVGREGQTLASIQYLASRIIVRKLGGSIRLHVDAGNYRERQDDKLKELALALAAKAKKTGRQQLTRPLSAYQRRIVHLALENDAEIATRSKGEGAQRRVAIFLTTHSAPIAPSSEDEPASQGILAVGADIPSDSQAELAPLDRNTNSLETDAGGDDAAGREPETE